MDEQELSETAAQPDVALGRALNRGKTSRWMRVAMQCVAGALSAAAGGMAAFLTGAGTGFISGAAGAWSESEQDAVNQLMHECLRQQQADTRDVVENVMKIMEKVDLDDDATAARVESAEYQILLKRAFRQWTYVESEEKREYIRRLLTHAADPRVAAGDFIQLFIDWIGQYSELHFRVMRVIYQHPNELTRGDIWAHIHGGQVRDDSKEADIFKCLIGDLSMGHVIRQERAKTGDGVFIKDRAPKRSARNPYMKSAFDDGKIYEMTEIGNEFVHYTMTEIVKKIG